MMAAAPDAKGGEKQLSAKYVQKREQILQRAAEQFNLMGVKGATLETVAQSVNLNLTSIRHYFLKKDDLVAECYLRSIAVHAERLKKSLSAGPPEARVRDMIARHFEFRRRIREGKAPEVMIFGDLRSLSGLHADKVWPTYVDLFRTVRSIVADSQEINDDRKRVNARAHMLISQLMRAVFWLPKYEVEELGRVEDRFTDILVNGVGGPKAGCKACLAPLEEGPPPDRISRESFLRVATVLINEQGYRGASVERIAARLNVTKGSFYHHLDAKVDLVVECFNRNYDLLRKAQRNAIASEIKGLDQACSAAAALIRRQQTDAGPLLRNSALMSVDPDTRTRMLDQMENIVDRFSDMISDGMIDGSARRCDARIAGQMLMAQINSASELRNWVPDVNADTCVDLYVRPIFRGLWST
jgi:AcrR family transcriptional regulator